jgi:hypothetical protein
MELATMTPPRKRTSLVFTLAAVLLPLVCGGCPEFRDSVVDAAESATQAVLLSQGDPADAVDTAGRSVGTAVITLFFDQFRPDRSNTSRF